MSYTNFRAFFYSKIKLNLHLDRGLSRLQMTMWSQIAHQVGRKDFEEFGRRIGLGNKLIKRELDEFVKEKPLVQVLIDRSFLSEELKK